MSSAAPPLDPAAAAWRALGAADGALDALVAYGANGFRVETLGPVPLPDEPHVATWAAWAEAARVEGAATVLRRVLPPLRFPLATTTRDDPRYVDAIRRGIPLPDDFDEGPGFEDPAGVTLSLHPTAAGRIPVITARARADFQRLVQALARRADPAPLPPSMGAIMVAGYPNWARVHAHRAEWRRARGGDDPVVWAEEFARLKADPARWQDRFMILGDGPYAAVPAAELGLEDAAWRQASLVLRRAHEAAHHLTRRLLGSMRNALHDELLADYAGIVAARGAYAADWGRRLLGVTPDGAPLPGGRLWNYRGTPPLDDEAMGVVARVASRAAEALAAFDPLRVAAERAHDGPLATTAAALVAIAAVPLLDLAAPDGAERLAAAFARVRPVLAGAR